MFYVVAGMYVFGAIFFVFTADGEVQSWAKDDKSNGGICISSSQPRGYQDLNETRIQQITHL